uniref:Zn(2)-C6 fungal-type domain-containing protein n=1 Tax=Bionectria ochroleuca TaxID=29856 RepID=A0A8H7NCB7_BIOOC
MVGVPGKSKACINCRKRRSQCDMKRPSCGQCQRSGIKCAGYQKEFIFLNSTTQEGQDGSLSLEKESYSAGNRIKTAASSVASRAVDTRATPTPVVLHETLERSAYENNVIDDFWASYLPNGCAPSEEAIKYSTYGWTSVAQNLHTEDPTIRIALLASALGMIGRQRNNSEIFQQSRKAYGKTLLAVEKSLRDPGKHEAHVVLTALRLVSFYELWFGSDGDGSAAQYHRLMAHTNGTLAYLLTKGPDEFSEGCAHQLFSEFRLSQVVAGLYAHKVSPLARHEWKGIPWNEIPKTPRDTLFDIMLEFPGLFEESDRINALGGGDEQLAHAQWLLTEKCYRLHEDLEAWAERDGKKALELAELVNWEEADTASSTTSSEEFAMGHLLMLHHASRIILYDALRSHTGSNVESMPGYVDPRLYCRKMGNFIPFFLVPNAGSVFLDMAIFPITIALDYLSRNEETEPSTEKLLLLRAFQGHVGAAAAMLLTSYQRTRKPAGRPFLE